MASSQVSLPVELCMLIVEHLVSDRGLHVQTGLAALRLSSRLLHRLATPHFYKVIQLSHHSQAKSLVPQLRAQPKLCDSVRALWWNQVPPLDNATEYLECYRSQAEKHFLSQFDGIDEVAFSVSEKENDLRGAASVGIHYALCDVGGWRAKEGLPISTIVGVVPTKPSLLVRKEVHGMTREQLLPSYSPCFSSEFMQDLPAGTRGIWAVHLVVPDLRLSDMRLYCTARTVSHLTISLYPHKYGYSTNPYAPSSADMLRRILTSRRMEMLQSLHVQCVNFGATRSPLTRAKEAAARKDKQDWLRMLKNVEAAVDSISDPRLTFEVIELPGLRAESLMEDVRRFTLQHWQERVYHGREGPWKERVA